MKNGKATETDKVKNECYKCLLDAQLINKLTQLMNQVLEEGNVPQDWRSSTTISTEKKAKANGKRVQTYNVYKYILKVFMDKDILLIS